MSEAQGAIDAARAAGAEQYASNELQAATTALRESQDAVAQRDYRLALSRAIDASQRAQDAAKLAAEGMARARSEAEAAVTAATAARQQLQARLDAAKDAKIPARDLAKTTGAAAKSDVALQEARASLRAGDYLRARTVAKEAAAAIAEQIRQVNEIVAARPARPPRRRR